MTPRQRFGRYLAAARRAVELTQKDVAVDLGIPSGSQFVSNWENGKSLPPPSYLPRLVKLFKLKRIELKAKLHAVVEAEATERYDRLVKHLEGR